MWRFFSDARGAAVPWTRREWLRLGALASLSSLPAGRSSGSELSAPAAGSKLGFGRAKSVILVYCNGGQSQIDTWDPKPNAPDTVRGEFRPISTAVPGIQVSEHLPRLARLADRYTIVRNVSHQDVDHGSASYLAMTGRYHAKRSANPPPSPNDEPVLGAIVKRVRPPGSFPYEAVHLNGPGLTVLEPFPGQFGGLLGRTHEPLLLGDVTAAAQAVPELERIDELPVERLAGRQSLRATLDQAVRDAEPKQSWQEMNHLYRQAFELLASPRARAAFDLETEPAALRDRYGRYRSGQACLLARRLAEAGVPLITVMFHHLNRGQDIDPNDTNLYGWDTHNDIFTSLRNRLLPRFDQSLSALLEDLDDRGLLDSTLVVCMGEFGRAPLVAYEAKFSGASPGRKHWANVYSIVVAGAGVQRGAVSGASDAVGARPEGVSIGPWDIAATIFHALGIDPGGHYTDLFARPLSICGGRPVVEWYA